MKRSAKYIFLVVIASLWCVTKVNGQNVGLTIGETNTSSAYVPVNGVKATDVAYHSQMVYPEDSIVTLKDKLIEGLTFYTKNAAAEAFDTRFVVKMGTYEEDVFSSSALLNNVNYTKVYEGVIDASGEEVEVVFDSPYDYRGGNLVVDITVKTPGSVATSCSFKGSSRAGSSIMRCTGIAGRYAFMPRVTIGNSELPINVRGASNVSAVELCYGSTGDQYEWHKTLTRSDNSSYDTVIYTVDMTQYDFEGSDTTIRIEHLMPRNLLGCADTERLDLTMYRPLRHDVYDTVCQDAGTYTNYGLNIDLSGYTAGTRSFLTDESEWGRVYDVQCYDTTYLRLTINRSYKYSRALNLCRSRMQEGEGDTLYYMYGSHRIDIVGPVESASVTKEDTIWSITGSGCDSLLILHITVSPSSESDTTVYVRESELPYSTMGLVFNYASTRSKMFYNQWGCDSIVSVTLMLLPTYRDTTYIVGCGEYSWEVEGSVIATIDHDTMASHLLTSSDGLDSVVYLRYTRGSINRADTTVTACESLTWRGYEYTESTNIYDTVAGIGMECDTQYTWHIRINHPEYRAETAEVCDSIVWNGRVYRESVTDEYHYMANECENVDTLHLTVKYSTAGDTVVYAPQSYIYYDSTYRTSGDYEYVIANTIGCDSVVTIHLYVTPEGTPMPQLYAYEKNVLILNHYPFGDNTRVEYDSIYWEHDGEVMEGYHEDTYHLDNYGQLSGCFKVWVLMEGVWFPTNELCIGNGIKGAAGDMEYSMWPNPIVRGGKLKIETSMDGGGQMMVVVYDMTGRMVKKSEMSGGVAEMDCDMGEGVYIVRLQAGNKESVGRKLVVK